MSSTRRAGEWAEIIEPRSQQRMFVNLTSGECTWQLTPETPYQSAGNSQWWELFDVASKRYYYYHVASQRTVWQRPRDVPAADIVSLARIQVPQGVTLPNRSSQSHARAHRSAARHPHRHAPQHELDEPDSETQQLSSNTNHKRLKQNDCPDQPDGAPRDPLVDADPQTHGRPHRCSRHQVDSAATATATAAAPRRSSTEYKRDRVRASRARRNTRKEDATLVSSSDEEPQPSRVATRKPPPRKPLVHKSSESDRRDPEIDTHEASGSESDGSIEEKMQRIISDVNALQLQVGGSQPTAVVRIAQLQQSLIANATGLHQSPLANNIANEQATQRKHTPTDPCVQSRRPQFPRTNPTVSAARPRTNDKASSLSPNGQPRPPPVHTRSNGNGNGTLVINEGDSGFNTLPQPVAATNGNSAKQQASPMCVPDSPRTHNQQQMHLQQQMQQHQLHQQQQFAPLQIMPSDFRFAGGVAVSPSSSSSSGDTVASGSSQSSVSGSSTVSSGSLEYQAAPSHRKHSRLTQHAQSLTVSHSASANGNPKSSSNRHPQTDAQLRNAFVQLASQNARPASMFMSMHPLDNNNALEQSLVTNSPAQPLFQQPFALVRPVSQSQAMQPVQLIPISVPLVPSMQTNAQQSPGALHRLQSNAKPPSRSSSSGNGLPPTSAQTARQPFTKQLILDDGMGTLPVSCAGMFFRKVHRPPPPPVYVAEDDGGSPTPSCLSPETVTVNPLEQFLEENRKPSKKGLFSKQKSISSLLSFSKEPLSKPLLCEVKDKQTRREVLDTFRCIQQFMHDAPFNAADDNDALLDLVCDALIARGWQTSEVRDEIYLQIGKQLCNNSSVDSLLRGWELLALALDFFAPSGRLHPFLDDFIKRHVPSAANMQAFAQFSSSGELAIFAVRRLVIQAGKRLARISKLGRRKLVQRPTYSEVRQSRLALFQTSMFGASLDELLEMQRERGLSDRRLPWIQTALSDEILRLGGNHTEGIFRVSADCDEVNRLRACVEHWELPAELNDPHVPASLLKHFYRELPEPLIPASLYADCVDAHADAVTCLRIVNERLPLLNRLVLCYLVRFLQVFAAQENVAHTKMDVNNLAMVMAPNILRCESDDPDTMFTNSRMEMHFLRNLIQHLDTACIDSVV